MTDKKTLLAGCFGCLGLIAAIPIASALNGWAISVLWNWFAVPYLHVPTLAIVPAIGLRLLWSVFAYDANANTQTKSEWWEPLPKILFAPLVAVGIGWMVRLWL